MRDGENMAKIRVFGLDLEIFEGLVLGDPSEQDFSIDAGTNSVLVTVNDAAFRFKGSFRLDDEGVPTNGVIRAVTLLDAETGDVYVNATGLNAKVPTAFDDTNSPEDSVGDFIGSLADGPDKVIGSLIDDEIGGEDGNDVLRLRAGDDIGYGGRGSDRLFGGAGDDELFGGLGQDRLFGQAGSDELFGGAGRDILRGGAGDDVLDGDRGPDTLYGGAGADEFVFDRQSGKDTVQDFRRGDDRIVLDDALWAGRDLSAQEVVDEFASLGVVPGGSVTISLDFGRTEVTLRTNLAPGADIDLAQWIDIV